MKKITILMIATLVGSSVFSQVKVEKRKYRNGYNVQVFKKNKKVKKVKTKEALSYENAYRGIREVQAINTIASTPIETNHEITSKLAFRNIEKKTKKPITAPQNILSPKMVATVGEDDFGKAFTIHNDLINATFPEFASPNISKKEIRKAVKTFKKKSRSSRSRKSQTTAVICCALFLLTLIGGIHRFYLGYIGIGIVQLLTLGGCGLWFLVDFIRLLSGDLKPNNGSYYDAW